MGSMILLIAPSSVNNELQTLVWLGIVVHQSPGDPAVCGVALSLEGMIMVMTCCGGEDGAQGPQWVQSIGHSFWILSFCLEATMRQLLPGSL